MNKEESKIGMASFYLGLIPLFGIAIVLIAINSDLEIQHVQHLLTAILLLTVVAAPIIGMIFGVVGLFQKKRKLMFPVIGTVINCGWIFFLIWGYMTLMTIAHSI